MKKETFVKKEQLDKIIEEYRTPFHLYDEKGIRANMQALRDAFSWNEGYKEYGKDAYDDQGYGYDPAHRRPCRSQ